MPRCHHTPEVVLQLQWAHSSCSTPTPSGVPSLKTYPAEPSSLGEAVLAAAYGSEEGPEARYLERLPLLMAHHVPVRNTSKLLRGSIYDPTTKSKGAKDVSSLCATHSAPQSVMPGAPAASGSQAQQLALPPMPEPVGQTPITSLANWQAQQAKLFAQPTVPPLPIAGPQVPEAASQPPAPQTEEAAPQQAQENDKEDHEETQAVAQGNNKKTPGSLAHFTELAMNNLQERKQGKGMKRPASSLQTMAKAVAKAKSKATAKPKPLPKEKPSSKKPKYGCSRCRGNKNGCSTCWNPSFGGARMNRQEWRQLTGQ